MPFTNARRNSIIGSILHRKVFDPDFKMDILSRFVSELYLLAGYIGSEYQKRTGEPPTIQVMADLDALHKSERDVIFHYYGFETVADAAAAIAERIPPNTRAYYNLTGLLTTMEEDFTQDAVSAAEDAAYGNWDSPNQP